MQLQHRIEELERELWHTRRLVIKLLPEAAQDVLESYMRYKDLESKLRWEHAVVEAVIELAEPIDEPSTYFGPRAYCPLCGAGTTFAYTSGFTVPEGLKRHLTGWGNIQQCDVIEVAVELAHRWWGQSRRDLWDAIEQERQAKLEERRKSETQFRISPGGTPMLIDEGLGYGQPARSEAALQQAEQRLLVLGFSSNGDERIREYVREFKDVVVYADPRPAGGIQFNVFAKGTTSARARPLGDFKMQDSWKHDLEDKFRARLEAIAPGQLG